MKRCFLIGHRDAPWQLQERLDAVVEELVTAGEVSEFIVGRYGNFDRMATIAIQRAMERNPDREITALVLEPYFPGEREILIPRGFRDFYYPEGMESVPARFCIEKANRKALEISDCLVAYVVRDGGNAAKLYRAAKRREKQGGIRVIEL